MLYIGIEISILVSMKRIEYAKYHALGNDFLIIDRMGRSAGKYKFSAIAKQICSRSTGVGADGILVLTQSRRCDFKVDLFNSDGSWAEKSGNGLRIAASYYHANCSNKKNIDIETSIEDCTARIMGKKGWEYMVRVSLGQPKLAAKEVPVKSRYKYHINRPLKIEGFDIVLTAISIGNPHAVIFVDKFDFDWKMLGEIVENSKPFPNRTNVEFAKVVNRRKIILNDWERGAGATGSSGTGAGAAAVAGVLNGLVDRKVNVSFPLGNLQIDWEKESDLLYLTGPAKYISKGIYYFD